MADGFVTDEVAIHSRQKQALLKAYLKVWTLNVAKNYGEAAPSLDVYDLFAGTGRCIEKEFRQDEWNGTALVSAEQLKEYPSRQLCRLVLNSWAENEGECAQQVAALEARLAKVGFERANRKTLVFSEPFTAVLPKLRLLHAPRAQYPSLWILDPYKAHVLPWTAVQEIANQVGVFTDRSGRTRRPELFIHFMTSTLQRNVHNPEIILESLGCSLSEWNSHLQQVQENDGTVLDALSAFYYDQLHKVYGREPFAVGIPGKDGNPVSVVFFAVERDAAWHSIRRETLPHFEKWRDFEYKPRKEWVRARHKIDRDIPEGQRQRGLFDKF